MSPSSSNAAEAGRPSLADAFGRGTRPGKTLSGRGGVSTPRTAPSPDTEEKLVAAGIWLPGSVRERLNAYCQSARLSQGEVILRAVDHAADRIDELAAKPAPEPVVEHTGGLFPRPLPATEKDSGRGMSVRFRSDHLTTLSRLAADHDLKRSVLIKVSLIDYFESIDAAQ